MNVEELDNPQPGLLFWQPFVRFSRSTYVIAKQILDKNTYLHTRCCDDQEYSFLSSKEVNQVFAYAVAWASK